ncbi:MAG: oxidoreductase [Prevotella sp.]
MEKKVIILTGASSGIGFQTAEKLARQGHVVYGAARRVEKMEPLKAFGVRLLQMDVTSEESIGAAVDAVIRAEGRVDVLVNNAGYGSYGAVEDVSMDEARRQFDVNLFGVAMLTKKVLPCMRRQCSGTIVNISSMGGRFTFFLGAWYHATKYALEAFSDALRMETRAFGINVVIIEPGGIKTPWGTIAADHLEESARGGAYEEQAAQTAAGLRKLYGGSMVSDPKIVAEAISRAVNSRRPRARYLIGFGAKPLVFMHSILPTRWFDWLMMNASKGVD